VLLVLDLAQFGHVAQIADVVRAGKLLVHLKADLGAAGQQRSFRVFQQVIGHFGQGGG